MCAPFLLGLAFSFFLYVLVSVIFVIVTGDYGLLEMIATGK